MKPTALAGPIATVLAALFFVAAADASQAPGQKQEKWWQSDLYKRELILTVAQSNELEEIFQKALPNLRARKKAFDEAEALFERDADKGDKKAAAEQIPRMTLARRELSNVHYKMLLDMRFVLKPEQWAKFEKMQQQQQQQQASEKQGAPDKSK
jgi:Spy/CpxP family protein refolding chaperone